MVSLREGGRLTISRDKQKWNRLTGEIIKDSIIIAHFSEFLEVIKSFHIRIYVHGQCFFIFT